MKAIRVLMIAAALTAGGVLAQQGQQGPGRGPQQMQQMQKGQRGPGFSLYFQAAQFLGVTPRELGMVSGGTKTLAQVAAELGKTAAALEAALVTARNQSIDQQVQAGQITAQQATTLKASSAAVVKALVAQPVQAGGPDGPGGRGGRGPGR